MIALSSSALVLLGNLLKDILDHRGGVVSFNLAFCVGASRPGFYIL